MKMINPIALCIAGERTIQKQDCIECTALFMMFAAFMRFMEVTDV